MLSTKGMAERMSANTWFHIPYFWGFPSIEPCGGWAWSYTTCGRCVPHWDPPKLYHLLVECWKYHFCQWSCKGRSNSSHIFNPKQNNYLPPPTSCTHVFIFYPNDLHYYLPNMVCVFLCDFIFAEMFLELALRVHFRSLLFLNQNYIY